MNNEFLGKKNLDTEDRQKVLESYDKFQRNKLDFINEVYSSVNTQTSTWILYNTNIHFDEMNKDKDLMYYSGQEIENIIASKLAYSEQTKSNILVFINKYMEWNIYKGNISINPCQELDIKSLKKSNKLFTRKKIESLDEFWDKIRDMDMVTDISNFMPLILARYGIVGKELSWMINLRWNDIYKQGDRYFCNIMEKGKLKTILPLDETFIYYINRFKQHKFIVYNKKEGENRKGIELIDYGYVLKKSAGGTGELETYNTIFGKVTRACASIGIRRISFNDMVKSRKIDMLLNRRLNGKLTTFDIEEVDDIFSTDNTSVNGVVKLKKLYTDLTGEKVLSKNIKPSLIEDPDSIKFVEDTCIKNGFNFKKIKDL